ncbi:MAG: helix-turn-helix transcriptional regulator [Xanthomonadales bacterium]|nr:helix-turn-helix transcriptional regulator [Xanthomonadales bacterium]
MSQARMQDHSPAPVFAALGSVTRLELISRLSDGNEQSITALSDDMDLTRQAVTKHLKVLQQAGLVERRWIGRESRFTIRAGSISQAKDYLTRVSTQWDEAIARLKCAVEQK